MECSVGPRTVMVNVKGALVSRDVFVVFGQWDMGTMQHMISGDGLPWNDPLAPSEPEFARCRLPTILLMAVALSAPLLFGWS